MESQHDMKKDKKEGSGLAAEKAVVKEGDTKAGEDKGPLTGQKDVTGIQVEKSRGLDADPIGPSSDEDIGNLKGLLGARDASGSGGVGGEDGDGED
ncbi:hypothetical protein L1987_74468 [Smallanthus sonchifolius]|uniref:Uncharacterized protein n=1 Tax=Smallanthus sonchifolius TaxID=185202 RepID=A0ACB9A2A2_9ASTR|nr:hypothetical protein L1987_74468 [Smallanthus sonchifolius]